MKKIFFLVVVLTTIAIKAQTPYVTVTTRVIEPSFIEEEYFFPASIITKTDSVINGYGNLLYDLKGLRYISEKHTSIIEDWDVIPARKIKSLKFKILGKEFHLESIVRKGDLGTSVLMAKIRESNRLKLYIPLSDYFKIKEGGTFYAVTPSNPRAAGVMVDFRDATKPMPKRVGKFFNNCTKLQKKIKKGEYSKSYDDFIKILDFYDNKCF